jgi:NIMA-interacting peptidyl-prolyl cis-trans isomerase 1
MLEHLVVNGPPPPPVPPGWVVRESLSRPGYVYYFHQDTGECLWQLRIPPSADDVNQNDGSSSYQQQHVTTATTANNDDKTFFDETHDDGPSSTMNSSGISLQQEYPRKSHHHAQSPNINNTNEDDDEVSEDVVTTTDRPKKRSRGSTGTTTSEEARTAAVGNSRKPPKEVRVLHILKKHKDSRRPSSWRHKGTITSTKEQAIKDVRELLEILQDVQQDPVELRATFEELARTESDCSSAKRGGDLGFFGRKKMQPAFEHASFALDIGQLSEIVDTSSGVHIILRIE